MSAISKSAFAALALTTLIALTSCSRTQALPRVEYASFDSDAEQRSMRYAVYTPPGWKGETELPLVVLLHGAGDDEEVLGKNPEVTEAMDEWINAGVLPPFVMVVPNGDRGMWTNWDDGTHRYEDYVLDEVVASMRAQYPIVHGRQGLHLMGISMGGAGTARIAMRHRDRFASATIISAPMFDVDQVMDLLDGKGIARLLPVERIYGKPDRATVEREDIFSVLTEPEALGGMEVMLAAGRRDVSMIRNSTSDLHEHLAANRVPHRYMVYDGGHRWSDWSQVFPVALCKHLSEGNCPLPPSSYYELQELE